MLARPYLLIGAIKTLVTKSGISQRRFFNRLGLTSAQTNGLYILMEWKSDYESDT